MKKFLILFTVITMMLSMTAFAAEFKDMPDNWSTEALNAAVNNGLMSGNDGYIYPDNPMTRAEMAAIITRATGATIEADISAFSDVSGDDWFYSVMAKAVEMKAFNGSDGKLNPESNITRQEAFVVLARVFGLDRLADAEYTELAKFSDGESVADWAKKEVNMIIKSGYVGGSDGKINPLANITRAEFATVMNRLIKYYIDTPGEHTLKTDGNTMVRCGGVTFNNVISDKMICVGDIPETEEIVFNECLISGNLIVRGGRVNAGGIFSDIKTLTKTSVLDITKLVMDGSNPVKYVSGKLYLDYVKSGQ